MQTKQKSVILPVKKDGFIACPRCLRNKRLQRVPPDMEAQGLPVYCRDCKSEVILDISKGQRVELRSP